MAKKVLATQYKNGKKCKEITRSKLTTKITVRAYNKTIQGKHYMRNYNKKLEEKITTKTDNEKRQYKLQL